MENPIAVISLVIAALAVFFGPLVQSWIARQQMKTIAEVTQKQLENALSVAKRQIVSPIRQKWIDDLRSHVAELISTAQAHWIYPKNEETAQRSLLLIEKKIELMLNPHESDHEELRRGLARLIEVVLHRQEDRSRVDFTDALSKTTSLNLIKKRGQVDNS